MVVACIALFVAGAGSATAARMIGGEQIRERSITSKHVRNGSLLRKDFKRGQVPRGRRGPRGASGSPGRAGTDGFGVLAYPADVFEVPPNDPGGQATVACPAGLYPTGGDAFVIDANGDIVPAGELLAAQFFVPDQGGVPSGWSAVTSANGDEMRGLVVEAICANAADAPTTRALRRGRGPVRALRPR